MIRPNQKARLELYGESISFGAAAAKALLFKQIALDALELNRFPVDSLSEEIVKLERAVEKSREQLHEISERLKKENRNSAAAEIFSVQMLLIDDPTFTKELKWLLKKKKMNVENVVAGQMRVMEKRFVSIDDEVIRTRFLDIKDIYNRILRNLLGIEHVRVNPMQRIIEPIIFVSEKLVPSDIALLDFKKIRGIIIEEGSKVSHVAVISKSLEIPAIINVPGAGALIRSGDQVIIDAFEKKVIIHPRQSEIDAYREKKYDHINVNYNRYKAVESCCETKDGYKIRLEANIGSIKDAKTAKENGAEGIGLLRSELFYLSTAHMPSIEEEIRFYREIISIIGEKPVTIRLLDLGADKSLPYLTNYDEGNPQLGNRGIRYLLKNPSLLRHHLHCVLEVARHAFVKIAIPFIATIEDYEKTYVFIKKSCRDLQIDPGIIHLGIMAEIPSVVLSMGSFLAKADFVNVGTNDLVQYVFAASREDANMEEYRQCMHPAIIKIIQSSVNAAKEKKKELSICGEMASDPVMAALMVGVGVKSFSMQPGSLPLVRKIIKECSFKELQKTSQEVICFEKEEDVKSYLRPLIQKSKEL